MKNLVNYINEKLLINKNYEFDDKELWDPMGSFTDNDSTLEKGHFCVGLYNILGCWDDPKDETNNEKVADVIWDYAGAYKKAGGKYDITENPQAGAGEVMFEFEGDTPECKKIIKQMYYYVSTGKEMKQDDVDSLTDEL